MRDEERSAIDTALLAVSRDVQGFLIRQGAAPSTAADAVNRLLATILRKPHLRSRLLEWEDHLPLFYKYGKWQWRKLVEREQQRRERHPTTPYESNVHDPVDELDLIEMIEPEPLFPRALESKLTRRQNEVLELHVVRGYDIAELAAHFEITDRAVRATLSRALEVARRHYENAEQAPTSSANR